MFASQLLVPNKKKIRSKGLFLCVIEEDADADPPPTVEELSGNLGFAW